MVCKGGSRKFAVTFFKLPLHHLDCDHRVVYEQSQGYNERAKRNALQVNANDIHDKKSCSENERDCQGDDDARAPAERKKRDSEHD